MLGWVHSEIALDLRVFNAWPITFWLNDSTGLLSDKFVINFECRTNYFVDLR